MLETFQTRRCAKYGVCDGWEGGRGGCIDALKLLADVPVSKEAVVPDTRVPQPVQNRGSAISVHQTNCFTSPQ